MPDLLGLGSWGWLAVVAALFAVAGMFIRFRLRRRTSRGGDDATELDYSRLEVLEATQVDADRRLLLVRCDDVEHLIMVGGPADLVVENDIRRKRAAHAADRPTAASQMQARPASAPVMAAAPAPAATVRPQAKPAEGELRAAPADSVPAAMAAAKNGPTTAAPAVPPSHPSGAQPARPAAKETPRRAESQQAPRPALPKTDHTVPAKPTRSRVEPEFSRREPAPMPGGRGSQMQPVPLAANQPEEPLRLQPPADQRMRMRGEASGTSREAPFAAGLPAADVPWAESDSLEGEIVRALRTDPHPPLPYGRTEAPGAKAAGDPATTLGDLAERLEEALAREVQAANQARTRRNVDLDEFGFDGEKPSGEQSGAKRSEVTERAGTRERGEPAERPERKERPEPPRIMASTPQPEQRRESRAAAERQEEAPVISLNARRREASDPLEDEMARLLGELTGDINRR